MDDSLVFLLTGCASGIGRCLAGRLIAEGHRVCMTDINVKGLSTAAREITCDPAKIVFKRLDVSDRNNWKSCTKDILKKWMRIDCLINSAGFLHSGQCENIEWKNIDRHVDINIKGVMYGTWSIAGHMISRGSGHIINFSSLAGIAPIPGIAHYSATKFAVRGFSLAAALELKSKGVAVTVMCIGAVKTPMLMDQVKKDEGALMFSGISIMEPNDICDVIIKKVLKKKPLEVILPRWFGITAKIIGCFPLLMRLILKPMRTFARKNQISNRNNV